ncbi:MAG TPA: MFS transporter [Methanomicrobia archaeon]|nr:MFS transporter [Methanomicrobia archaeon]
MSAYSANIRKMYALRFFLSLHFIGGVLVPFFLDWGGIRYSQIMLLQSFFVISIFVLEVPTGAVADYFGRKASLLLGALSLSAATVVYAAYPSLYIFAIGEFLWALGGALLSGAAEAFVYDTLGEMGEEHLSKRIFGRFGTVELIALMVSSPVGSVIASTAGLRYAMLAMSIPFFIAFLICLTLEEPPVRREGEDRNYFTLVQGGIEYFRHHRILQVLAFDSISIGVLAFFVIWTYQPLLQSLGISIIYFGFINAAMTGAQIPIMNNFERLERLAGSKRRYLAVSSIVPAIGFILLGFVVWVPSVICLLLIICGFGLTRYVLFQSYFNKHIASHNRATVISTISMLSSIVQAIVYPIVGYLVEWSLPRTLIIIGVAMIICTLISRIQEEYLID